MSGDIVSTVLWLEGWDTYRTGRNHNVSERLPILPARNVYASHFVNGISTETFKIRIRNVTAP